MIKLWSGKIAARWATCDNALPGVAIAMVGRYAVDPNHRMNRPLWVAGLWRAWILNAVFILPELAG